MKAVILAGGEGVRLRPLTLNIPKPMVPIFNAPFLEIMLANLKNHGINDVIMTLCYLPDRIQEYFGNGHSLDMNIEYVLETSPLGTAGAVKNVEAALDSTFIVLNGDIVTDLDISKMIQFHKEKKAKATIFLREVDNPSSFGVVETDLDGKVSKFLEKPEPGVTSSNWINGGIYILEPDTINPIPSDTFYMFEKGLFPYLLESGQSVYGFRQEPYWIDVGTYSNYIKVNMDILDENYRHPSDNISSRYGENTSISPASKIYGNVRFGDKCKVGSGTTIDGPSIFGNGCSLGDNCTIAGSIFWESVDIGDNVSITDSVIGNRVSIGYNVVVDSGCIIGDDVVIENSQNIPSGSILE